MKFLKFILSILIFISPANANTIFYLIKIPNLEIHSGKSVNGLKYLKAIKPFSVGIRDNNVSCFNSSEEDIKKKMHLIEKNLNRYSSVFLNKINLKYIVLCENLTVSQINTAGVPNPKTKTLIVDIKFNEEHFERVLHHEVFHIINDSFKDIFNQKIWSSFNPKEFNYAECSTCTKKLGLETYKNTKGFFTEYSKTTPSEDMAEVFSHLIINKYKNTNDETLNKKVNFIKNKLNEIDNTFLF